MILFWCCIISRENTHVQIGVTLLQEKIRMSKIQQKSPNTEFFLVQNMEIFSANLRIQIERGKTRTRKTLHLDTFHAGPLERTPCFPLISTH